MYVIINKCNGKGNLLISICLIVVNSPLLAVNGFVNQQSKYFGEFTTLKIPRPLGRLGFLFYCKFNMLRNFTARRSLSFITLAPRLLIKNMKMPYKKCHWKKPIKKY